MRSVRLRPALIFKRDAASGIRRLFSGRCCLRPLVRPGLVPFVPDVERLRFQAVHSLDIGDAYGARSCATMRGAHTTSRPSRRSTLPSWRGSCARGGCASRPAFCAARRR